MHIEVPLKTLLVYLSELEAPCGIIIKPGFGSSCGAFFISSSIDSVNRRGTYHMRTQQFFPRSDGQWHDFVRSLKAKGDFPNDFKTKHPYLFQNALKR